MSIHIQLDCPHDGCLTEKAGFSGFHYLPHKPATNEYILLLQCGVCGNGVIAKYFGVQFVHWVAGNHMGDTRLIEVWPKRQPVETPQHLPPNVSSYYFQGMDSLRRNSFDA